MTAIMTTVPAIVPTLWALATILSLLFGTQCALAMIQEKAITKSTASYGN
jgi:hypothetical protein